MEFRIATIEDAEKLALFGSETFWQAYRSESALEAKYIRAYMSTAFSVRQITHELGRESLKFILGTQNESTIGYAKLNFDGFHESLHGEKPMEIERIYLARSYWGKELGADLLAECLRLAEEAGCDCVWLGVWQRNERAIRFYKKHGFEIVGTVEFDLASSIQQDHVMEFMLPGK